MKKLRILSLLLFPLSLLAQGAASDYIDVIHQISAQELEDHLRDDSIQSADEGWDEHFRTSDIEGEKGTQWNYSNKPPTGLRVGCICMDGSRRDERGRGACGGYGGVRFWIYQVTEDSTSLYPTQNHFDHPEPLSEMELNNLSSRTTTPKAKEKPSGSRGMGTGEWMLGIMGCLTIAYVAKMMFKNG